MIEILREGEPDLQERDRRLQQMMEASRQRVSYHGLYVLRVFSRCLGTPPWFSPPLQKETTFVTVRFLEQTVGFAPLSMLLYGYDYTHVITLLI